MLINSLSTKKSSCGTAVTGCQPPISSAPLGSGHVSPSKFPWRATAVRHFVRFDYTRYGSPGDENGHLSRLVVELETSNQKIVEGKIV